MEIINTERRMKMSNAEKAKRISEIQELLIVFSEKYLNDALSSYALKLLEKLSRKRILSITKGKKEIWAPIKRPMSRRNTFPVTKNSLLHYTTMMIPPDFVSAPVFSFLVTKQIHHLTASHQAPIRIKA